MELANVHLEELLRDLQEKVLGEGRAITRDKATERMRAQLPQPHTRLEQHKKGKEKELAKGEYKAEGAEDVYFAAKDDEEEEHPGRKG